MEKKDLRIVFMGTPDFAVPSLKAILDDGLKVVGVITAPDRQSGRGRKVNISAVKAFAMERGLKILQPLNLKDKDFQKQLEDLNPNLQVVVAFRMLPKSVWGLPELGTFNLHASLLPHYRGAAPINYAIINGEKETGLTTFLLDEKIDTGRILLQEKLEIQEYDNAGRLHDKLMTLGSKLVIKTINGILKNDISLKDQAEIETNGEPKKAYKIGKEDCRINWNNDSLSIRNLIRGLSPYPAAFSVLVCPKSEKKSIIKIYDVDIISGNRSKGEAGSIFSSDSQLLVGCSDGQIRINELQMEGKKRIKTEDFLRGYTHIGACHFESDTNKT